VEKQQQAQEELCQVISETFEEEMKRALENYQLKKQYETQFPSSTLELPASSTQSMLTSPQASMQAKVFPQPVCIPTADVLIHAENNTPPVSPEKKSQENQQIQIVPLEKMTNFETFEIFYKLQHQFKKSHSTMTTKSGHIVTMSEEAKQILRACLRLESILNETRWNMKTAMELDSKGRIKSCLKVHLIGARDLPYAHLRTKNLDPYVTLQIVYNKKFQPKKKKNVKQDDDDDDPQEEKLFRSRTMKKTMYPVWEEDFDISPIQILQGYLHVRILNDRRNSREQLIGEVKIPLKQLTDQKRLIEWYPLTCSSILNATSSVSDLHHDDHVSSFSSASLRNGNGAVHLELQLTFNKMEKMKRKLDEMILTYFEKYQELPCFIQPAPVDKSAKEINFVIGSSVKEENTMMVDFEENTEISRETRIESNNSPKKEDTLENLEESLRDFKAKKSEVQKVLQGKKKTPNNNDHLVTKTKKTAVKQRSTNQSKISDHVKRVSFFNVPTGSTSMKSFRKTIAHNNQIELKRTIPQLFTTNSSLLSKEEATSYGKIQYIQPALQRPLNKPSFDRPECFDEYSTHTIKISFKC
jgi:hypothetical protein